MAVKPLRRAMTPHRSSPIVPRKQSGQAAAEFLVAAAVFAGCLLCLPYLAKLGQLKLASIQAARHAAWERSVWRASTDTQTEPGAVVKTEATLQDDIRHHFFSAKTLRNETRETQHSFIADWEDARTRTRALASHDKITVSSTDDFAPGWVNTHIVSTMLDGAAAVLGGLTGLTNANYVFDLDFKGLHKSSVGVEISSDFIRRLWQIVQPGETPPALSLNSQVALVGGEWNGGGYERTKKKVLGLVITGFTDIGPLQELRTTLKQADELMNKFSGAGKRYVEFGMDPTKLVEDNIPDDRKEETDQPRITDPSKRKFKQYEFSPPIAYYVEMPLVPCMSLGVPDPTSEICKLE